MRHENGPGLLRGRLRYTPPLQKLPLGRCAHHQNFNKQCSRAVPSEPVENSDTSASIHIPGTGRWRIAHVLKRDVMTVTVRIISILAVAITIGPSLAYGSPACMTESEARAKFPKAHLVWVGINHCWTFGKCVRIRDRRLRQSRCLPRHPYSR